MFILASCNVVFLVNYAILILKIQLQSPLNEALQQNMVEIATLDHPGLLAKVGGLFMMQGLDIHSARIATLGERAEDIFL